MSRIVFIADGGRAIGSGHVMRCLSLASAFADNGWQVSFAVGAEAARTLPALGRSGYEVLILPDQQSAESDALKRHWPAGADILVIDHYARSAALEQLCRPWAKRVVAFDDLANRSHDADVLIDPGNTATAYQGLVPRDCVLLAGPRYALVHRSFQELRRDALARRNGRTVERVLLSFGQMDAPNATLSALDALESLDFDGDIDIAVGSAAPNLAELKMRAGGSVHLHVDSENMADLITAADLAVGAGGGSAWERCCLGLPTVLVEIAENQRGIIALLRSAGAGLDAGIVDAGVESRIRDCIQTLLEDFSSRTAIAERAANLVDGRGALRVLFGAIGGMATRDGSMIGLRPAEADDEAWLLDLQRRPETRRFANVPAVPTEEDHRRWFAAVLADPTRRLLVVDCAGKPAGILRLDRGPEAVRVSIAIHPDFHRLGAGAAVLALAARAMPGHVLEAEIFPENAASLALFSGAGYRQVSPRLFRRMPS